MSFRKKTWSIQLVRHATLIINVNDATFLVDPMLSPKGAMDPVGNAGNDIRIPMVDLPLPVEKILKGIDMVLITHTHRDHWDAVAQEKIDKSTGIFCQPTDIEKVKSQGFTGVFNPDDEGRYNDLKIYRTSGRHGTGEIGQKMGPVSGFVIEYGRDRLYIAGDTIWCTEVEETLKKFKPQTIVVNAGGAQFLTGDPITMDADDITAVSAAAPSSKIIAVHMDTVNHCKVTRDILKKHIEENKLTNVVIPADGETLTF